MASPENPNESTTAIIASTISPQSAAFQDSSIFNYINNLSPIKPVKGTSVIQVFSGLNSPPLVFTSPRIHAHQQSIDLKRSQCHVSSHIELSRQDHRDNITTGAVEPERLTSHMSGLTPLANSTLTNFEDGLPKTVNSMNQEGSMENYANEDGKGSNVVATDASPTFLEQPKQDHEGNLSYCPKSVENDGKTSSCPKSNSYQKVPANISVDQMSVQKYDQRVAHRMQPVFGYKDYGKQIGSGNAKESIVTTTEQHSKVGQSQSQLGKRRRLQFETAEEKIVENDPAGKSEIVDSCCDNIQSTGSTQSTCPLSLSQSTRNASLTVSKPSGIGLHLNSIVNARPLACPLNVSVKPTDVTYSSAERKKSISISSHMQNNMQRPSISSNSNLVENVSATSEEYTHETPRSCPSYNNAKPMKIIEHQDKFDPGRLNSEQVGRVNELERSNPKKKRKKTQSTGDGCKHCNCKKSKCLKLYCDCFAAGIYCAGPCSCQGCFNRPEYEDTVLETRQQIESRNPLAFAPKIIHRLTQPPISQIVEDGDQLTPLAGRHKRGCNCKKSMCLKKYCECYQANVGCSDGCRCEDCQNIYGKKGVSSTIREMGMEAINEKLNDSFDDKIKVGSIRSRSSLPEFQKPHNLTPQTPSFQCSNHGNDASKARVLPGRYIPSPESESTFYPSYVSTPRSPKESASFDMITEASNQNSEMVPFGQDLYTNVEFMDEFSPGCTNSGNATGHLTSMADWSNSSRAQLLPPGPGGLSFSSLSFRGSSVTPVTLFGGTKLTNSQQKSVDIYGDDTPNILKDASIQPNKVKVTSPNKKRISPPRIRLHELGSNTLKSGRKFILKAVPSFPPLTPCIDSKDNTNHPPADNTL